MANKTLFSSSRGPKIPTADTTNEAGGVAYAFTDKHALAQYACTGCLNGTYYASAGTQLDTILEKSQKVEPLFLAKLAVYARKQAHMKDVPALLCAILAVRDTKLLDTIFDTVIDNGKMLRNFVQILRSGTVGRKSLGSRPKKLVQRWLATRSDAAVFRASVGRSPSMADVIKMVHPRPQTASRQALYGYLLGRSFNGDALPAVVQSFEQYKADRVGQTPNVPFQMLTALGLGTAEWTEIARRAHWQMTRMNLNTFARHGVFQVPGMTELIASRLRDRSLIAKSRVFPYQLLMAYHKVDAAVPSEVREALQDAMEIAVSNVPTVDGKVYILADVSGSMGSPVTGYRKGATTLVRCVDVAALVAATFLRQNPNAEVLPFDTEVRDMRINPRDSIMTNAQKLASLCGGGTHCSKPLQALNKRKASGDLVIFVSDNESWVDTRSAHRGTAVMSEWQSYKARNPAAKLVCLDVQPYAHTQAKDRKDILNIGGFSDTVFSVIDQFARGENSAEHWVSIIERVTI
jgi:60 kDa SS-A/Ro ribonucleoprotein